MAKSNNQKAKILVVQRILAATDETHVAGMQEILDQLADCGISAERKSIYDDIVTLREFGYPICLKRGKNGGYYLGKTAADIPALPEPKISVQQFPEVKNESVPEAAQTEPDASSEEEKKEHVWCLPKEEITKGEGKNVRLLLAPSREQEAKAFFGELGQYKIKEDGMILVTLPSVSGPVFFGWLTAMGTDAHILKPKKAAAAYRDYLKSLIKEYKGQ